MENKEHARLNRLEHSDNCPMKSNIYCRCICHYDDCLAYDDGFRSCICDVITAKQRWASYWAWRLALPKWKRLIVWLRKPTADWFDFMWSEFPLKKLWY